MDGLIETQKTILGENCQESLDSAKVKFFKTKQTKSITINKMNNDIYYSVAGDSGRYFDLESVTINHPELSEYVEDNRIMLNQKMMQFRESYDSSLSLFE